MLTTAGGRTLARLCVALVVSQVGTNVSAFGMGVWLYERTHSAFFFALLPFATTLPSVLLSPFLGHVVDRFGRLRLMIVADLLSAAVVAVLAVLAHAGQLGVATMVIGAGALGVFAAAHAGALEASVSQLVATRHLSRANSLISVARAVPIVAPLLAVAIFAAYGLTALLVIDFATFTFSVLVAVGAVVPSPKANLARVELVAGFRKLRGEPGLCRVLGYMMLLNIGMGMIEVLLTPLVLARYTMSFLGTVMLVSGIGGIVGGSVSAFIASKHEVRTIAALGAASGVAIAAGTGVDRPAALLLGAFGYMACYVMVGAFSQSIWQRRIVPEWQGRVFLARYAISSSVVPFAHLAAGPLLDHLEAAMHAGGYVQSFSATLFGPGEGRAAALIALALGTVSVSGAGWLLRAKSARALESVHAET